MLKNAEDVAGMFFLSCHSKDFVRLFLMQLAERLKSLSSLKKILLNYSLF